MSNLFGIAASGKVEAEKDFSKRTLDSDIYGATIKMIFVGQAKSGARNVTIQLKTADGKDYSETIYVTNKEGKNTYEKDGVICTKCHGTCVGYGSTYFSYGGCILSGGVGIGNTVNSICI